MEQTTSARKKKITTSAPTNTATRTEPATTPRVHTSATLTQASQDTQPARAVDAFPPAPKTNWQESSQAQLMNAWNDAVSSGVMLRSNAAACAMVRTQEPDLFLALFPTASTLQADFCRRQTPKIQARLQQTLGSNLKLQILCDDSVSAASTNQGASATNRAPSPVVRVQRPNPRDLMRQVEQLDVARQIIDVFNAELADVKLISNHRNSEPPQQ